MILIIRKRFSSPNEEERKIRINDWEIPLFSEKVKV
jgi:hypothetical protein